MKNYFEDFYNGKRYGWENYKRIKIGRYWYDIPYFAYDILRSSLMFFILFELISFVNNHFYSNISILFVIMYIIGFLLFIFMNVSRYIKINCRYASKEKDDITEHIKKMKEKSPEYENYITDIKEIDGWFMVFEKHVVN